MLSTQHLGKLGKAALLWLLTSLALANPPGEVAARSADRTEPIRGVWVAGPEHNRFFESTAEMARQLQNWRDQGINTVFVSVWSRGRTLYPSAALKRVTGNSMDARFNGRDPLQEVLTAAHQRGIKVYAWFEFGFASDYQGGPGSELLALHPHWAAVDQQGRALVKNGFRWLNTLDTEVQEFVLGMMAEVVDNYAVDGVQGDDRLPALPSEGGYDLATVARYRLEHSGQAPPRETKDASWVRWRAEQLNRFVQRLRDEVKRRKPSVQISMAPSPFPWSRDEYLQDWPNWLKNGWIDSVSPQLYRYHLNDYQAELKKIRQQVGPSQRHQVFPGVLLALGSGYLATHALIAGQVEMNRAEGFQGEVFFHSEGLSGRADYFGHDYRVSGVSPAASNSLSAPRTQ